MKISIIFSSVTGNTQKIAHSIGAICPDNTPIFSIQQAPDPQKYDLLLLGFWVRRGAPDSEMTTYMQQISRRKVAYFGTLGAYPDSPHALQVVKNTNTLLKDNTILGGFLSQGKIHNSLTETMRKNTQLRSYHPMTPERLARHKEAAKHPNKEDLLNAQSYFLKVLHNALHPQAVMLPVFPLSLNLPAEI